MSNFKNSFRKKNTGNFKTNLNTAKKLETFDFEFDFEFDGEVEFSVERDILNINLPEKNKAILFLTDRVRNPNLLIENIDRKEKVKSLIIIADKISGCTYLDIADILILRPLFKSNNQYNIHAKIYIINDFVILTSANLNKTNSGIEQYLIINSKCLKEKINCQLKKTFQK